VLGDCQEEASGGVDVAKGNLLKVDDDDDVAGFLHTQHDFLKARSGQESDIEEDGVLGRDNTAGPGDVRHSLLPS